MQKFWSILFGAVMLGSLLLFIVSPMVGWWLPKNVATFGGGIDGLFYLILAITGIFFVLTEAILVYNLFKFSHQEGHKAAYIHGNHKLEMWWTVVPGLILIVLAIVQIKVWAEVKFEKNMPAADGATQQIEVMAKQWEWRLRYPSKARMDDWSKDPRSAQDFATNAHEDDVHLPNEVHIWMGAPDKPQRVLVHLKTLDVIHSFFLPNLRLKQDALPGKTIKVWFAVTEYNVEPQPDPGSPGLKRWVERGGLDKDGKAKDSSMVWELACAEFCGTRHSMMRGKLYVHKDKADYLDWLKQTEAEQHRRQGPSDNRVVAR